MPRSTRPLRNSLTGLLADRAGATAIEYVLIASLISIAALIGCTTIAGSVAGLFEKVASSL